MGLVNHLEDLAKHLILVAQSIQHAQDLLVHARTLLEKLALEAQVDVHRLDCSNSFDASIVLLRKNGLICCTLC